MEKNVETQFHWYNSFASTIRLIGSRYLSYCVYFNDRTVPVSQRVGSMGHDCSIELVGVSLDRRFRMGWPLDWVRGANRVNINYRCVYHSFLSVTYNLQFKTVCDDLTSLLTKLTAVNEALTDWAASSTAPSSPAVHHTLQVRKFKQYSNDKRPLDSYACPLINV